MKVPKGEGGKKSKYGKPSLAATNLKGQRRGVEIDVSFRNIDITVATLDTALVLLTSDDDNIKLRVIWSLVKFAELAKENMVLLIEKNIYERVLPMLQTSDKYILRFSLKLLAIACCQVPIIRQSFFKDPETIDLCLKLLGSGNDLRIQEYTSKILVELLDDGKEIVRLLNTSNILDIIYSNLSSIDPDIKCNCLEIIIHILRSPQGRMMFLGSNTLALEPFIMMLQSHYPKLQLLALQIINLITEIPGDVGLKAKICSSEVIQKSIALFKDERFQILHPLIVSILKNCTCTQECVDIMINENAIPSILLYTRSSTVPDLCGMELLALIAVDEAGRKELNKRQVTQFFVTYLNPDNLSVENEVQGNTKEKNVPKADKSPPKADKKSMKMDKKAAKPTKPPNKIPREPMLEQFLSALTPEPSSLEIIPTTAEVLEQACLGISRISSDEEAREIIMLTKQPLRHLVSTVFSSTIPSAARQAAARAIRNMSARDARFLQQIVDEGAHLLLYHVMRNETTPLDTLVCLLDTIGFLMKPIALKRRVISKEAVEIMLLLLVVFQAANTTPCGDAETRLRLDLCIDAAKCLAVLLTEPQIHDSFLGFRGPHVLHACLRSPSVPLRHVAVNAVEVASADHFTALAFVQEGVLDTLLADTTMIEYSPSWKRLIDVLYKCHLPTKFAYTDKLETTDITQDFFYITTKPEKNIRMLHDLIEDPISAVRPILVVNFNTEPKVRNLESTSGDKAELIENENPEDGISDISNPSIKYIGPIRRLSEDMKYSAPSRTSRTSLIEEVNPEYSTIREAVLMESYIKCAKDTRLLSYLETVASKIQEDLQTPENWESNNFSPKFLRSLKSKVLAVFVANAMSGGDATYPCTQHDYELHLAELKRKFKSNVIPLGMLKIGMYLERALLYKVLADQQLLNLPCALVRGKNGRAWVEISFANSRSTCLPKEAARVFVVDLMDVVGAMYEKGTIRAEEYCNDLAA